MTTETATHAEILKRLKEISQAKDLAYDSAIYDKGAALKKLEAEERELRQSLDQSDIMTNGGHERDSGTETNSSVSRGTSEPHAGPAESRVAQLHEGESPEGISSDEPEGSRRTGAAESGSGQEVRRESDSERSGGLQSVAEGDQRGDIREGNRLASADKDLVLSRQADIGHDAGAATRFDANLNALRVRRVLQEENRHATPEEQAIMAKYSGFGDSGMGEAFPAYEYGNFKNTAWGRRREELKALTTEEEFRSIEHSRLNAFYTTPEVISYIWKGLEKAGVGSLKNPRILEPSAGSGRFLGYEPEELARKSDRVAVELDTVTGDMLREMYPKAETYVMGFEKAPIAKDSIDIAVSNVPFGNYPIFDPEYRKDRKALTHSIHNYFFAKTLEELRPGGMLAFITSHETLDAPSSKRIRQYLANQADMVAAIRLPNNAFPDTKVVTDIIFMRKRMPDDKPGDQSWVETTPQTFHVTSRYGDKYDVKDDVNNYFVDHPEMVLGTPAVTENSGMRSGDEYTVMPKQGVPLASQLENAIREVPSNIITEAPRRERMRRIYTPTGATVHEGSRVIGDDGAVYVKTQGALQSANLTAAEESKVKAMLGIRDAAKTVVDIQVRNGSDAELRAAQEKLAAEYKGFVLANGPLSAPGNSDLMEKDPDSPFLKALERNDVYRVDKKKLSDADRRLMKVLEGKLSPEESDLPKLEMPIFKDRVIHGLGERPVATVADAESVVKNELGRLDFQAMAEKLGRSEKEVIDELAAKGLIYKNPVGDWEPADEYLTGDVRKKLRQAEAAASARPREYERNVEALRTAQPEEVTAGQISARMGAPWIPESDINQFVRQLLNARSRARWREETSEKDQYFHYSDTTGEWVLSNRPDLGWDKSANEQYGTSRIDATHLVHRILNGKLIEISDKITDEQGKERSVRNNQETIAAQEKAKLIQEAFQKWLWKDPERTERLVKEYNERFNNYRPRFFDGSHQELPGITEKWNRQLHSHQKDAIWRVVQDRTALLAHEVGFGKTAVMVISAQELRRLGLSRKNLFVVPKATHAQFRDQYLDVYPYAKVLYPGEDDFTPAKRAEFMSRAITGDWDAIIVADSQFRRIPIRPETEQKFVEEEMETIRAAMLETDDKKTQKELEKSLERARVRMEVIQAKIKEKDDRTVYFEDIGVDQMYVDEADAYKNLHFTTTMGRIKGLPNSESERAWDMYEKVRTLQQGKHNGVVFATGTPVANTIAEMYTNMRYLQEPMLEEKGLKHFDAWAKTFGETTETLEQTPTGAYRMTQRFAKFGNAPELSNMWQTTADIRVADEVPEMVKQRPRIVDEQGRNKRIVIAVPPDQALTEYMAELAKRADELKNKDPHEDNMLKISSDARKASLDMRLVKAGAPVNPNGKVAVASHKIAEIYKLTNRDKGTQLVFLDMGTPKAKDKTDESETGQPEDDFEETGEEQKLLTDVYRNIKAQLVADGVPEGEIAFIHDAKNDKQKQALYARVNKGEIRVLIGSTGKMGAGVNVQERAAAVHHLDAPWRPRDIEQREGRIIRQGNRAYGPQRDADGKIISSGPGVRVYSYVTERSFDAYMWQAIEAKSKAIKAIMRRSVPPRTIEDIDSFTMSASEAKALASGNPDVLKAVSLKNAVTRLQMLRASHTDSIVRANTQLRTIPGTIETLNNDIAAFEQDAKVVNPEAKFAMAVRGREYKERPDAGEAFVGAIKDAKPGEAVAKYQGFDIRVNDEGPQAGYKFTIVAPGTNREYPFNPLPYNEVNPTGIIARFDNRIKGIPAELAKARERVKDLETNLKTYREQAEKPFDHETQLREMEAELARVEARLQDKDHVDNEPPSDNYAVPPEEEPQEGAEPEYHWGARDEEVNPAAEIKALKAEVETVEKPLEVKPPAPTIEKTIDAISRPASEADKADRLREIEAYARATGQTFKPPKHETAETSTAKTPTPILPSSGPAPLALPAPKAEHVTTSETPFDAATVAKELLATKTYHQARNAVVGMDHLSHEQKQSVLNQIIVQELNKPETAARVTAAVKKSRENEPSQADRDRLLKLEREQAEAGKPDYALGVRFVDRKVAANPDNLPMAKAFTEALKAKIEEYKAQIPGATEAKARKLRQNINGAQRDVDRMERSIAEIEAVKTGESGPSRQPVTVIAHSLPDLVKKAEAGGIKVEYVPPEQLHDFAAMNWKTAEKFGIKDYPKNTVRVDEKYHMPDKRLEDTEFENLKHELDEASDEQQGEEYWPAHEKSLRDEKTDVVDIPAAEPETLASTSSTMPLTKEAPAATETAEPVTAAAETKTPRAERQPAEEKKAQPAPEGKELAQPAQFPKRDEAMDELNQPKVVEVHDDGDLTVKKGGTEYVVTTEGQTFKEVKPGEEAAKLSVTGAALPTVSLNTGTDHPTPLKLKIGPPPIVIGRTRTLGGIARKLTPEQKQSVQVGIQTRKLSPEEKAALKAKMRANLMASLNKREGAGRKRGADEPRHSHKESPPHIVPPHPVRKGIGLTRRSDR